MLGVKVLANTKRALIALTILALLSATALIVIPTQHYVFYFVKAESLSQQPDAYFALENPDAVVSQAISNTQETVTVYSLEDTQLDEMIDEHNTNNVQVNDSYYEIRIGIGDRFPVIEPILYLTCLFTLPLSLASIAIITLRKIKRQNSNKKTQTQN